MTPLLLYTPTDTPRLRYVCRWIFEQRLGLLCNLTTDTTQWTAYPGPRLWYATAPAPEGALHILPQGLLAAGGIQPQPLSVNRWKRSTILFYNQPGAVLPFDILSAVFYLISRYEEYLPHSKDRHGRYPAGASAAAQYAFLQEPVVDQWLEQLRKILERKFNLSLPAPGFTFRPTYDIDIAWKYRHKGPLRHWGGYLRDLLRLNLHDVGARAAVTAGRQPDPYNSFAWLDELHRQYSLQPQYFLLLAQHTSAFDKNADPQLPAMQQLIKQLAARYATGIHPSYASGEKEELLQQEIAILQAAAGHAVAASRQHYIRLELPHTYRRLIQAGITHDYSMGYASANGFRAGTSCAFAWYDLESEAETGLQVHPFVFMEATARFYHRFSPQQAWLEWERLWHAVKKTNGTFISIWHNHLLGTDRPNSDWRTLYQKMLAYAQQG